MTQLRPSRFAPLRRGLGVAALCLGLPGAVHAEVSEARLSPIVRAVQSVRPSVVNIQGQKTVAADAGAPGATRQVNGMGTGVVIDPRGYILTNHHVVDGVRQIRVTLDGGAADVARIVAFDRGTDLAVIKIEVGRSLPVIPLGSSDDLMTGESVIAVGNAYGYEHTVTRGIISALHRDVQVSDTQAYDDLIQTDASINPGNSGGPLLNIEGRMIGVNVAVRAGAQGIGFAIPVDSAIDIAASLMSVERLENKWHGIQATSTAAHDSLIVNRVAAGSPAAKSGLRAGDVLERLGDTRLERPLDVERALLGKPSGEPVSLSVRRGAERLDLVLATVRRGAPAPGVTPLEREPLAASPAGRRDQRAWEVLGLELAPEPAETLAQAAARYRGGMRVVDVRPDGPAAAKGIRPGDVLVGMHRWETASAEDIRYIVNNRQLATMDAVKFYILRGDETLYGEMAVAAAPGATVRR
ncbi:MAG: trypsin-like peptidase domain-containing protein [Lacipirellulaceae bacterium]